MPCQVPVVDFRTHSTAVALFLGAAIGAECRGIRLVGGRVLQGQALRTCRTLELGELLLSAVDVNLLRGVLARNPHLDPEATLETLLARERALVRMTVMGPEMEALLRNAVQAVVAP